MAPHYLIDNPPFSFSFITMVSFHPSAMNRAMKKQKTRSDHDERPSVDLNALHLRLILSNDVRIVDVSGCERQYDTLL